MMHPGYVLYGITLVGYGLTILDYDVVRRKKSTWLVAETYSLVTSTEFEILTHDTILISPNVK